VVVGHLVTTPGAQVLAPGRSGRIIGSFPLLVLQRGK
jgi:hypothetical protein